MSVEKRNSNVIYSPPPFIKSDGLSSSFNNVKLSVPKYITMSRLTHIETKENITSYTENNNYSIELYLRDNNLDVVSSSNNVNQTIQKAINNHLTICLIVNDKEYKRQIHQSYYPDDTNNNFYMAQTIGF